MKTRYFLAAGVLAVSGFAHGSCRRIADLADRIEVRLVQVELDSRADPLGRFQVINHRPRPLALRMANDAGRSYLLDSDFDFQFLDINGQWVTQIRAVSSIVTPVSSLPIPTGESTDVWVPLPGAETAKKFKFEMRMLIRLPGLGICAPSTPFSSSPPGEFSGYKSR